MARSLLLRTPAGVCVRVRPLAPGLALTLVITGCARSGVEEPDFRQDASAKPSPRVAHLQALGVSAGHFHTCALLESREVMCWGAGEDEHRCADEFSSDYQCGQSQERPGPFLAVSAGGRHTCALREDGAVVCWGGNNFGQASPPPDRFISLEAGFEHTCGLREDGRALCWGRNEQGQSSPPDTEFSALTAATLGSCGLRLGGLIQCWGSDSGLSGGGFVIVALGDGAHLCGLLDNGELRCSSEPRGFDAGPPYTAVTVGLNHVCALRPGGRAICWGRWGTEQVRGACTWVDTDCAQTAVPDERFVQISAGMAHTCGVRADGVVVCWGAGAERDDCKALDCGQAMVPEALQAP